MKYALIERGTVTNMIAWDGDTDGWTPPDGVNAREIKEGEDVGIGYTYDEVADTFTAPPPPPAPVPTAAEVLAQRDDLLRIAALRIAPLQDAVDLGDATAAETAALKAWKQYRVALSRIEQLANFPAAVAWPKVPS